MNKERFSKRVIVEKIKNRASYLMKEFQLDPDRGKNQVINYSNEKALYTREQMEKAVAFGEVKALYELLSSIF